MEQVFHIMSGLAFWLRPNPHLAQPPPVGIASQPIPNAEDIYQLLVHPDDELRGYGRALWKVTGPIQERPLSLLFRAENTLWKQTFMVKYDRSSSHGAVGSAALREHDSLRKMIDAMGAESQFSVPRPYFPRLARQGLVVTEWLDGSSIDRLMLGMSASVGRLVEAMHLAGEWLRRFHRLQAPTICRLDTGEMLERLAEVVAEGDRRSAAEPVRREAIAMLTASATEVGEYDLPGCRLHNDFKPSNLILSGNRIFCFDFDQRFQAACHYDLVNFLFHLEMHIFHPARWRLLLHASRLASAFLEGYTSGGEPLALMPLHWLYLHRAIRSGAAHEAMSNAGPRARFLRASHTIVLRRALARFRASATNVQSSAANDGWMKR